MAWQWVVKVSLALSKRSARFQGPKGFPCYACDVRLTLSRRSADVGWCCSCCPLSRFRFRFWALAPHPGSVSFAVAVSFAAPSAVSFGQRLHSNGFAYILRANVAVFWIMATGTESRQPRLQAIPHSQPQSEKRPLFRLRFCATDSGLKIKFVALKIILWGL